jgi:hypothetical protein
MKKIALIALVVLAGTGSTLWLRRRGWGPFGRRSEFEPLPSGEPGGRLNDETLKSKIESEVFRHAGADKGRVNVNSQHGVVQLRGEVESQELVDDLVERVRAVDGVVRIENLLHVPGEPVPMHQ